jgi:hypothetical protein
VSTDVYNRPRDYSPAPSAFLELSALGGYRKLVSLAENGPIPDPDDMAAYKTVWSWFNTWNGNYIMNESQNESSHVISVYHDARIITLDELPDLRAAPGALLYGGTDFGGSPIDLPLGRYDAKALAVLGVVNGQIGSLKIPAGWRVVVNEGDNFTGKHKNYPKDTADLTKRNFNDQLVR